MHIKTLLLFFTATFYLLNCAAQDTIQRKNRLNGAVIEKVSVLKTNKETRQGTYEAFFERRTLIARGNYTRNKKTGIWNFYKPDGKLVQRFDYDKKILLFESAMDTMRNVHYLVDEKLNPTDTLTRPVKIGGTYFGLLPYVDLFLVSFDTTGINMDEFDAYVELLISPLGRLASYKVRLVSSFYRYDYTYTLDVNLFNEEDKQFIPVTRNGQSILSRIMIGCSVGQNGRLELN